MGTAIDEAEAYIREAMAYMPACRRLVPQPDGRHPCLRVLRALAQAAEKVGAHAALGYREGRYRPNWGER